MKEVQQMEYGMNHKEELRSLPEDIRENGGTAAGRQTKKTGRPARRRTGAAAAGMAVCLLAAALLPAWGCGSSGTPETTAEVQETKPETPGPADPQSTTADPGQTADPKTPVTSDGITAETAVYPASVSEGMSAEEFAESDAHWEWWDEYRQNAEVSAKYRTEMEGYYQSIMEQMLVSDHENTVCSPLNTYVAFAVLAEVSGGSTRQQILDMLGVQDMDNLRTQVNALWESNYVDTPTLKSLLANSLWLRESTEYNEETLRLLAEQYYASTFTGDPGSEEMSEALRQWTDENTGGLLSDYTKDLKLNADTVLAIVSTIYYKAAWMDKFYPEMNTQETFHGTDGDTTVDMMHMTDIMSVYQTDAFTSVGLNLNDSGTMVFFLPAEGTDVNALAKDPDIMKASGNPWEGEDENWIHPEVNLSLPKFSVSCRTDLLDILKELGVTDALDPAAADFTPLTEAVDELYVAEAEHAAMVEIDEDGVTGAAYTELMVAEGAALPGETLDLVFDRPFLFMVTGKDGSVLFSGIVRNID